MGAASDESRGTRSVVVVDASGRCHCLSVLVSACQRGVSEGRAYVQCFTNTLLAPHVKRLEAVDASG